MNEHKALELQESPLPEIPPAGVGQMKKSKPLQKGFFESMRDRLCLCLAQGIFRLWERLR